MVHSIDAQAARKLIDSGEVEVIDVREPQEWSSGHLPGARHVPLGRLRGAPKAAFQRDRVIFVCAAGVRSEAAAKLAVKNGLATVYNLVGGTKGWVRAGLPLVQD